MRLRAEMSSTWTMKCTGLPIGVAHQGAGDLGPDEPSAGGEVDLLDRVALGPPVEQGRDLLAVGVEVLGMRDLLQREGQELGLGIARDLLQRAVDLQEGAVEVDERHADRRVGEARSKRSSACASRRSASLRAVKSTKCVTM